MTPTDKEMLLGLVARPDMYVPLVGADCLTSFVWGYEAGTGNACDFTEQLRHLLADRYRQSWSSAGWAGQIRRLAQKRASTWVTTFRQVVLELLVAAEGGRLQASQQAFLKRRIVSHIERIGFRYAQYPDDAWVEVWQALCAVRRRWFRPLWTGPEWKVIKELDALVQAASESGAPKQQAS